mgnify:CR=1 FL=1
MIKLKIESLRTFLKNTAYISKNELLPVLVNIKIHQQEGVFYATKNNIQCVCVHPLEGEGRLAHPILIDISILAGLLTEAAGESVTIEVNEKTLIWDNNGKTTLPLVDPSDFPMPAGAPDPSEAVLLNQEVVDCIVTARHYINPSPSSANFRFVSVKERNVSAFHGQYFYVGYLQQEAPQLMLSKEECDIISALGSVTHTSTERHNYFYSYEGAVYIFTKPEERNHNLTAVLKGLADESGKKFTMCKQDWVTFCTKSNIVNGSNDGGLKEIFYDQSGREAECSRRMIEKWPGVCTANVKEDGRPDVKINWKAVGQPNVNSIFGAI